MNMHITRTVHATLAGMSARHTSVCLERYGASDLHIQLIRPRDAAAARFSLAANPRTNHVSSDLSHLVKAIGKVLWCKSIRTAVHYHLHQVAEVKSRRRLRSAVTAALIVPAMVKNHGAFYDRLSAFSVAAARALGDVISVPSGFPEASGDSFIYLLLPLVATLFYVLYCHLVLFCSFTCFSIVRFSL